MVTAAPIVYDETPEEGYDVAGRLARVYGVGEASQLTTEAREVPSASANFDNQPFSRRVLVILKAGRPVGVLTRSGRVVPYPEQRG